MKMRYSLFFALACVFLCAGYADEKGFVFEEPSRQEIVLDQMGDWCNDSGVPFKELENGVFSVKFQVHFYCAHTIIVKPGKKYTFTAEVSADSKIGNYVSAGYVISNNLRQIIHGRHYRYLPDSITELAEPAKEDQDFIIVKKHPQWGTGGTLGKQGSLVVAFNAKEDCSDLPNMEVSTPIKEVIEVGDNVKVTFQKKLYAEYPAGTKVRIHRNSEFYYYNSRLFPNQEWQKIGGVLELPKNAKFFYPCLIYYGPKDKNVKFRNMRLIVE